MRTILFLILVISLVSCSVPQYSLNNIWRLTVLNGDSVIQSEGWENEINFMLEKNNRIDGFGGCNQLTGSYEKQLFDIKFNVSSTKRFCEGKMETENAFIKALNSANRYDLPYENELCLYKDSILLAKFMGTIIM